ncbi:hypothetical protein HMPREF1146_1564 [Prevotella sp. MSX73]|nr:hypothetical protein HMPREF1146_1564 [Prevotella sp. MSX73]
MGGFAITIVVGNFYNITATCSGANSGSSLSSKHDFGRIAEIVTWATGSK